MDLIFGMAADGSSYPDFPGLGQGALDSDVVGPARLLERLELHLGLSGLHKAEAVRIAAYVAKLRAACALDPHRFFAASLDKDPWATARLLLDWRDQLIAAGWSGAVIGTPRVDALAVAEIAGPTLPAGQSDRVRAVLTALDTDWPLELDSLTVVGGRSLLPPPWHHLVEVLGSRGVKVRDGCSQGSAPVSDLRRAQDFLDHGLLAPLTGDGSFVVLEADTSLMAAEAVAEWLAAGPENQLEETVVVSPEGDTTLLDAMLVARGLPALGQSSNSPYRGALQVLPLAFAIAWKPFNPKALLDLLLLPRAPVGRAAARRLANALVQEPGTGADAWERAWAAIRQDLEENAAEGPNGTRDVVAQLGQWCQWTKGGRFDRIPGMPISDASDLAARVQNWARRLDPDKEDPLLREVEGPTSALSEAIDILGQDPLPGLLLDRMIQQVLSPGAQNPNHVAQAGGLRGVKHPGALWAPAERVVWWDCKGPGERASTVPWSAAELRVLEAHGCHIETAASEAARISWAHANPAQMARKQLVLVCPAFSDGEETVSHPLIHQLNPLTRSADAPIRWRAERLLKYSSSVLAGKVLSRREATVLQLPQPQSQWTVPQSVIERLTGRVESATSFERLVECHLRWLLVDVLRLKPGRFAEIPGPNQLLGMLAHAIVRRVLLPGPVGEPEMIRSAVAAAFDELVPAIAAPLLQPEYASELAVARRRIPAAVAHLVDVLRKRHLAVEATETRREATFADGLQVIGYLDLLVRHSTLGLGVIDLKWTRNAKRRHEEVTEGRALQLATYGAIADPGGGVPIPGAYYLLRQRRLLGERGSIMADEELDSARSLASTWDDLVATWRVWRDLAESGTAVAGGADDVAAYAPDVPIRASKEPCRFCEITGLCRIGAEEV